MKRATLDLWVGIFVAIGAGALIFLSLKVANLTSTVRGPSYQLTARFSDIGGLKVHAPVKSAGVVVGRVSDIRFDNEMFEADVTLSIESPYRFPSDTSAQILTSGLLGDKYIGLSPGAEETDLKGGDAIEITQSAVVLENLIGQFLYNRAAEGGKAKDDASK